jgi:hypothetical protein
MDQLQYRRQVPALTHRQFRLQLNNSDDSDDCIIYRRIMDSSDIEKLQTDLNRLGEWAVENEMKINPGKSKAVSFNTARVKDSLRYCIGDQLIPEANSFKYLGIIICCDLSWADHVNYKLRKAWKTPFRNAYTQKGK